MNKKPNHMSMEKVRQFAILLVLFSCTAFISCELNTSNDDDQLIFAHVVI